MNLNEYKFYIVNDELFYITIEKENRVYFTSFKDNQTFSILNASTFDKYKKSFWTSFSGHKVIEVELSEVVLFFNPTLIEKLFSGQLESKATV